MFILLPPWLIALLGLLLLVSGALLWLKASWLAYRVLGILLLGLGGVLLCSLIL